MGDEITLRTGRVIRLMALHQSRFYTGLHLGYPHPEMNERRVRATMERATSLVFGSGPPHLIAPVGRVFPRAEEDRTRGREHVELPAIVCTACFESLQPARDPNQTYSTLTVVWFQDDFALPIAKTALDAIQSLDWDSLATDCSDL
jgi:hypothetical protein